MERHVIQRRVMRFVRDCLSGMVDCSPARSRPLFAEDKQVADPHPVFRHLKSSPDCVDDRILLYAMWEAFKGAADTNFLSEFQRDTPSRIWEMRLACPLSWLGFAIDSSDEGPDICVSSQQPRVWFEAFEEKSAKFNRYLSNGKVEHTDATVIAISASKIPHADLDDCPDAPTLVELAYGETYVDLGGRVLDVKPHRDLDERDVFNMFRPENGEWSPQISAALSSVKDIKNSSEVRGLEPGRDFVLVHNAGACTPLPRGFLKLGREYWFEHGVVRSHDWRRPR